MDRLERMRMEVDAIIGKMADENNRKFAYIHLYSTSQFASMLAMGCHVETELCAIAAMLHDIAVYAYNVPQKDHARKSAELAKEMLEKSELFTEAEINIITHAISVHSDKQCKDHGIYAEILKDADVLAHYFYNSKIPLSEQHQVRIYYILEKLHLHA